MAHGPRKIKINRQQEIVLLLSLFRLKHYHYQSKPKLKQVYNFVSIHNLMEIREHDMVEIRKGELSWQNDLAYRSEDLGLAAELYKPERGIWTITNNGEIRLLKWCALVRRFAELKPDWESRITFLEFMYDEKIVITTNAVRLAIESFEKASILYPSTDFSVAPEMEGKMQL